MQKTKRIIYTILLAVLICAFTVISTSAMTDTATESVEENVFGELFESIMTHAPEILSALAFGGSLLLSFSYKRGMLPTLKSGIGTIGTIISDVKDYTEKTKCLQEELKREVENKLSKFEEMLILVSEALEKSEEKLKNLDTGTAEREKVNAVISEQVSMLYDVFMFSSIPEYQKDAVGHRVEKMRKIISGEGFENEEALVG